MISVNHFWNEQNAEGVDNHFGWGKIGKSQGKLYQEEAGICPCRLSRILPHVKAERALQAEGGEH